MNANTKITTDLTDRYVWAVVRSLPEDQRDEVGRELRASIEDAIETRLEAGESAKDAEVNALQELGDPSRLAGQYADRPAVADRSEVLLRLDATAQAPLRDRAADHVRRAVHHQLHRGRGRDRPSAARSA